jgi:hypothetical protein
MASAGRSLAHPKVLMPFGLFVLSTTERRRACDELAASLIGKPRAVSERAESILDSRIG